MKAFYREYFDEEIQRFGTHCVKWDGLKAAYGRDDLIPAWVADMDFRTVPAVAEALQKRAAHAIYGYTGNGEEERAAEVGWIKRRYGLDIKPEWILFTPGVIDSLFFCVRTLTEPEDGIVIQPPVYGPFFTAVKTFGRRMLANKLLETDEGWRMDFGDLEKKFADGAKMMILCNPANPVGRVWSREELQRVVDLANRYGVMIVSDEIHADFNMGERRHTRILSLDNSDNCVMLTSATKSFNLAGLRQSSCIIRDEALRRRVSEEVGRAHAGSPNLFGELAQQVAYEQGDEWMDALVEYIRENRDIAVKFLSEKLPEIKTRPQEGTYLMWLDCSGLGMSHEDMKKMFVDEARVALGNGLDFGEEGEKHFRLNLATRRANIEQLLENIYKAIRSR